MHRYHPVDTRIFGLPGAVRPGTTFGTATIPDEIDLWTWRQSNLGLLINVEPLPELPVLSRVLHRCRHYGRVCIREIFWESDHLGTVTAEFDDITLPRVRGVLYKLLAYPSPAKPPSNGYAVRLNDQVGSDLLVNQASNCSSTATTVVWPTNNISSTETRSEINLYDATLLITGAGVRNCGTLVLFLIE